MNRIKMLREEKQMNMREVADALKIPYTTYVNYEKELREPNSEMLISLANYFEVSIDSVSYTHLTLPTNSRV